MRKRIQQLAMGKFQHARPLLKLGTDKIEMEVLEGKDDTGGFEITSANGVPMRGRIYTSNPRMECLTPQFEGEEVRIRYRFHTEGLIEGDVLPGRFYIICNQGEYDLPFVVSVSKLYADSSIGKIRSLSDFTKLAAADLQEALRLFESPNFKNIIKPEETREMLLYEGLCRHKTAVPAAARRALEEFLLGCNRKKQVVFRLSEDVASFTGVEETIKIRIKLKKENWGLVDVAVSCDADFIQLEKKHLTEEDFIGSTCGFDYYIQPQKLHAGRNFGRITFCVPGQTLEYRITVRRDKEEEKNCLSAHRDSMQTRTQLMKLYIDYRLKRIVTGAWAKETTKLLDHLAALEGGNPMYELMKAQALIANRQKQEAAWIMEDFKREWKDHRAPVWGYYLYLCTLVEREPSYVDRLCGEIEGIFREHRDSPVLFWVLLFIKEEYCLNSAKKLKAIENWTKQDGRSINGSSSPYLYLEAYYLIWQDPYLLRHLDSFEIRTLNWARKQNAISKDMARQIISLLSQVHAYDSFLYRILEACYQVEESEETLAGICAYLIRGQRYKTEYHRWYALGIEQELRIAGLYEAYLMSMDAHTVCEVPRMLQMYFQYNSSLSYRQKAVLFVNIIAGKKEQPDVYRKYLRSMEKFAMGQLEAGHMDDNLAVIYREMIERGMLSSEIAKNLAKVLFICKLVCLDTCIAKVIVIERTLKKPLIVPVTGGEAYFPVYGSDACILLEDVQGVRYAKSIAFGVEKLMEPDAYVSDCMALAPEELPYILYSFREREKCEQFCDGEERALSLLLKSEQLSDAYKAAICPEIISFYRKRAKEKQEIAALEQYLLAVEPEKLPQRARRYIMNLLVEAHLYEKAYAMVQQYGYDDMEAPLRVALCSYGITTQGYEEDDFLLGFVQNTFVQGKYSDVMLIYLCKYYNGPTKIQEKLWRAAGEFEIDTFDLEERILIQMLYTTDYVASVEEIYDSYYAAGGREQVCLAYLAYFSQSYVTKDMVIPGNVFLQLQERQKKGEQLCDACKLALLKYFSEHRQWSQNQFAMADELLAEYIGRNIRLAFFKNLDERLVQKYLLYDKFFLEYHATPKTRVRIRFSLENDTFCEEELNEVYDGIFVREFVLFFGEILQYYVVEGDGIREKMTASGEIGNRDVVKEQAQGRYAMLNDILGSVALQDEERLKSSMKNYQEMQHVTDEIFRLL